MLEEDQQTEEIVARVAALDIGKAELVCCVRVPDENRPGRRLQEVASVLNPKFLGRRVGLADAEPEACAVGIVR
jgi:transposase